jgi:hypothetical protein
LIVFLNSSIGFTQIQISPDQAKEAIRNAQRVESLKVDLRSSEVIILSQIELVSNLKNEVSDKEMIVALTNKNYAILQTQYEAEKARKPRSNWFVWVLATIAAFGSGFVVGSI